MSPGRCCTECQKPRRLATCKLLISGSRFRKFNRCLKQMFLASENRPSCDAVVLALTVSGAVSPAISANGSSDLSSAFLAISSKSLPDAHSESVFPVAVRQVTPIHCASMRASASICYVRRMILAKLRTRYSRTSSPNTLPSSSAKGPASLLKTSVTSLRGLAPCSAALFKCAFYVNLLSRLNLF